MKTKQLAIFDFDGTITSCDSFMEFAIKSLGKSRLLGAIFVCLPWIISWKLKLIKGGVAKQKLFSILYSGRSHLWFVKQGEDFTSYVEACTRPITLQELHRHIELGHDVYIISASMPEWIRPWALKQGIPQDHVLGTECNVDERGIITGKFSTPNCFGPEKVRRLAAAIRNLSSYHITVYGDSAGDAQLFSIADTKILIEGQNTVIITKP